MSKAPRRFSDGSPRLGLGGRLAPIALCPERQDLEPGTWPRLKALHAEPRVEQHDQSEGAAWAALKVAFEV